MNRTWKRLSTFALASVTAGACLLTLTPEADASRRASLAQNRLILDRNDIYLFPQLGVDYANLIALDYGVTDSSGSGLLMLGDESRAFGVGVFRGNVLRSNLLDPNLANANLAGRTSFAGLGDYPSPLTVVDLFGALDLDGGLAGARIGFGTGGNTATNVEDEKSGATQSFVNATLGYSLLGDLHIDAALNLGFATAKSFVNDVDQTSGMGFFAGVSVRGYSPLSGNLQLGFLADLDFSTSSATLLADPDDPDSEDIGNNNNSFALGAGAGPVYEIEDTATIAAYGIVGFARDAFDPDTRSGNASQNDRVFNSSVVLPGVHVAADIKILNWLYFRSGMQYTFSLDSTKTELDTSGNDDAVRDSIVQNTRDDGFAWRAGVGIVLGDFALDGTFQQGFLVNGPNFLSGQTGGLFSMVSMTYSF